MSGYVQATVHGKRIQLPAVVSYFGWRAAVVQNIFSSVYIDTEAIIETGCGWGRNLFDLIAHGIPRNVHLYCLEYTAGGRNAARLLAHTLAPQYNIRVLPFDYRSPDFSSIVAMQYKRVSVYSIASIEQVDMIPAAYVEGLLQLAEKVDAFHYGDPLLQSSHAVLSQHVDPLLQSSHAILSHHVDPLLQSYPTTLTLSCDSALC